MVEGEFATVISRQSHRSGYLSNKLNLGRRWRQLVSSWIVCPLQVVALDATCSENVVKVVGRGGKCYGRDGNGPPRHGSTNKFLPFSCLTLTLLPPLILPTS